MEQSNNQMLLWCCHENYTAVTVKSTSQAQSEGYFNLALNIGWFSNLRTCINIIVPRVLKKKFRILMCSKSVILLIIAEVLFSIPYKYCTFLAIAKFYYSSQLIFFSFSDVVNYVISIFYFFPGAQGLPACWIFFEDINVINESLHFFPIKMYFKRFYFTVESSACFL